MNHAYHVYTLDDKGDRVSDRWFLFYVDALQEYGAICALYADLRCFMVSNDSNKRVFSGPFFALKEGK